jgi:hypothetical protein
VRHTPRMVQSTAGGMIGTARILADVAPASNPGFAAGIVVVSLLCCTAVFAGAVVLVIYLVRRRQRNQTDNSRPAEGQTEQRSDEQ